MYQFRGHDWQTGKYWNVSLSESIRYNERIQADQLKREKLPILREYQEETIDLSCSKIFNKT